MLNSLKGKRSGSAGAAFAGLYLVRDQAPDKGEPIGDSYHGGFNYRIPPVGAIAKKGKVLANM